ncbi:MAG: alpha-amylase family protein [Muribaculaceae bacterium]|nr:alpha-amylase family protein [Muribaculaceae bacterium]
MNQKPIIYQLLPRLYTNYCPTPVHNGTLDQNGSGKLNSITDRVLRDIKSLGTTHIWYTGVIEHAHDADYTAFGIPRNNPHVVKGHAGSPYAITDYYDIDPDLAENVPDRIKEFEALIARTHKAGMKALIDFVPNHVAREYHSDAKPEGIEDLGSGDNKDMFFSPSNNFYYIPRQQFAPHVEMGSGDDAYVEFPAKASGNDCFHAFPGVNDWYDTVKLNYGVDPWNGSKHFDPIPPTWLKMLHILLYWAAKGVDGFRCDMVHMVPVEFWRWAIAQVKQSYPDIIFIAEIYDIGLYRPYIDAGFDYLYDKVNLYDTLRAIECNDVSAARITSCWQTVEGIGDRMLNFLENHDEQRFASPQYAGDPHRVVPSLVVSSMINTGPMMIYGGQELGEAALDSEGYSGYDGRTTIFDYWSMPTVRTRLNGGKCNGELPEDIERLRDTYARILKICNAEPAISNGRFFDLMYANYDNPGLDPHLNYAFLRATDDELLLIAVNFDNEDKEMAVNIPVHAFETLGFPEGRAKMKDLLRGGRAVAKILRSDTPFTMSVPAHGAAIWKVKRSDIA